MDLVEAARRGDVPAFGELYRIHLGDVRDFCARRISDPLRAEDLAQETFLKAYESIGAFRSGSPFWPWLSTIARNLCIDELRSRGRTKEEPSAQPPEIDSRYAEADVTADEAVTRQSLNQIRVVLDSALERLSDRDRQLLWSRAVEEKSWEQIALANDATVHSVRNSSWRARKHLRAILGDTLRDLRSRVAVPLAAVAARWRRLRDRWRSRGGDDYSVVAGVVLERGASLLVGLGVLSVALFSGTHSSTSKPADRGIVVLEASSKGSPALRPSVSQAKPSLAPGHAATRVGLVEAKVSTNSRAEAAMPSAASYRLEVYAPTGQLLYAEETIFKCGDGRASGLIPSVSPVQAYC